jgi:hypothetical protein
MRKPRLLNTVSAKANPPHRVGVSGNRVSRHGVSAHGVSRCLVEAPCGDAPAVAPLTSIAEVGGTPRLTDDSASPVACSRAPGEATLRMDLTHSGVSSENGTPAGAIHRGPDWHARLSSKPDAAVILAIVGDGELSSLSAVSQADMPAGLLLDVDSS